MRGMRLLVPVLLLVLSARANANAQVITGTIQGTISDRSGAILPGVSVTVKNVDTNRTRTTLTNETGTYIVPLLPVGGITPERMAGYVAAGASGFGIGSALYKPGVTAKEIAGRAASFTEAWRTIPA